MLRVTLTKKMTSELAMKTAKDECIAMQHHTILYNQRCSISLSLH
jgi:hypothetical protein